MDGVVAMTGALLPCYGVGSWPTKWHTETKISPLKNTAANFWKVASCLKNFWSSGVKSEIPANFICKTFCQAIGCRVTSGYERWWLMLLIGCAKTTFQKKTWIPLHETNANLIKNQPSSFVLRAFRVSRSETPPWTSAKMQAVNMRDAAWKMSGDAGLHAIRHVRIDLHPRMIPTHRLCESRFTTIRWCSFWNQSR